MKLTARHRKFVTKLLTGATAKDAYLHAFPGTTEKSARTNGAKLRNKPHIQTELAALREKADALPDSDFLTYVETRKFFARVVRAQAATLPHDSNLWNVRLTVKNPETSTEPDPTTPAKSDTSPHSKTPKKKSVETSLYLRFPDKLRALMLDAKLAGYDRPKPGTNPAAEHDAITALLTRIRTKDAGPARDASPAQTSHSETATVHPVHPVHPVHSPAPTSATATNPSQTQPVPPAPKPAESPRLSEIDDIRQWAERIQHARRRAPNPCEIPFR